jgi:hypothetical protein
VNDARFVDLEDDANELDRIRVAVGKGVGRRASGLVIVLNIVMCS